MYVYFLMSLMQTAEQLFQSFVTGAVLCANSCLLCPQVIIGLVPVRVHWGSLQPEILSLRMLHYLYLHLPEYKAFDFSLFD